MTAADSRPSAGATAPETAARALLALRDGAEAIPLPDWRARGIAIPDAAAAYAAQEAMAHALVEERGYRAIGYKIGATNRAARELLGVATPFYGILYDHATVASPATATVIPGVHQVLEPEIAIELAHDLDPGAAPFDAEMLRNAAGALVPAIEVIVSCFDPWAKAGGPTLIADNGAHGFWVPGLPVADWSAFDVLESPVTVRVAGAEPVTGKGAAVEGGPFAAAAWLANTLAARGRGLRAGDLISTGTVTPPIPVRPGMEVLVDYGPLGSVSLATAG